MRRLPVIIAILSSALPAAALFAAEHGAYVGAAVGEMRTDDADATVYDADDGGFKLVGGWRPHDCCAVEGSYFDLGKITSYQDPDFGLEQEAYTAQGVLMLELANVDLFVKGGIALTESERSFVTAGNRVEQSDHDVDFVTGFGVQVRFRKLGFRAEIDRFNTSNGPDLDRPELLSIAVVWTFGEGLQR
jgi:hypothetical protein